jgi:hypothetical protein
VIDLVQSYLDAFTLDKRQGLLTIKINYAIFSSVRALVRVLRPVLRQVEGREEPVAIPAAEPVRFLSAGHNRDALKIVRNKILREQRAQGMRGDSIELFWAE